MTKHRNNKNTLFITRSINESEINYGRMTPVCRVEKNMNDVINHQDYSCTIVACEVMPQLLAPYSTQM